MSDWNRIDSRELDRHITGNFGEDSVDSSYEEVVEALWAAFIAMGRAGANGDINHPLRKDWEAAREALTKSRLRAMTSPPIAPVLSAEQIRDIVGVALEATDDYEPMTEEANIARSGFDAGYAAASGPPREPTQAMVTAGYLAHSPVSRPDIISIWSAMHDAWTDPFGVIPERSNSAAGPRAPGYA